MNLVFTVSNGQLTCDSQRILVRNMVGDEKFLRRILAVWVNPLRRDVMVVGSVFAGRGDMEDATFTFLRD